VYNTKKDKSANIKVRHVLLHETNEET